MNLTKRFSPYRTPFPMEPIPEPVFPDREVDSSAFSSIQKAEEDFAAEVASMIH